VTTNDLQFLADVTLPDDIEIMAGHSFTKTGRVQNNGRRAWLACFLDEREQRLLRLAHNAAAKGDHKNVQALRTATFPVHELRKLLQAGNFSLEGDFIVRQQKIVDLVHGAL
jgi:hypothetical protein